LLLEVGFMALLAKDNIRLMFKWWRTWKSLPVFSWVRAAALYRQGRFADAEPLYRAGLDRYFLHPAQHCARLDLSYCLFKTGNLDAAEDELKRVINSLPRSREGFVRLARLQMWRGQSLEAAWTMRRAQRSTALDSDMACLFLYAALDARAPHYLIQEAVRAVDTAGGSEGESQKAQALKARACMILKRPQSVEFVQARTELAQIAANIDAPFEASLLFAEMLIEEGKIAHARRLLRRSLHVAADYPRLLSLLAESYLRSGPFYNPEYAKQLATSACQSSAWASPREMHVLAEAFYHLGDKISALVIASKAKDLGSRLLGTYTHARTLDALIEDLASGTQA
jgi:predicted Zn-dependent protease